MMLAGNGRGLPACRQAGTWSPPKSGVGSTWSLPKLMSNRRRLVLSLAAFVAIASALVPLHVDAQKTERAKTLGAKLMCMCGCGQILTQCNHINCPSSGPMLKELDAHVSKGEADDLIIQDFVQEYGEKVLSAPPAHGFNSIAWYIPGVAFVLGLGIVVSLIRLWRQRDIARLAAASSGPSVAATAATELLNAQRERARRQADRETEEL
jgi:cytochrome c-type biogenesis protein CcmH/NrfF